MAEIVQTPVEPDILDIVATDATNRGEPIRLRVALHLYDIQQQQYVAWKNQVWKFEAATIDHARRAQQAIELLFDLIATHGIEHTAGALGKLKRQLNESKR